MHPIQLQLIPHQTRDNVAYQHLRLTLTTPDRVIQPSDLQGLALPKDIQFSQGVVIEGRGPIWLYGYLIHQCHPACWIGCYDPRLDGAVITETHTPGISIGQVLKLTLP